MYSVLNLKSWLNPNPRVLFNQLVNSWSFLRVLNQTRSNQVFQIICAFHSFIKRDLFFFDLLVHIWTREWKFVKHDAIQGNSECPYIEWQRSVRTTLTFRCLKGWGSAIATNSVIWFVLWNLLGGCKIYYHCSVSFPYSSTTIFSCVDNVLRFDISISYSQIRMMKIFYTISNVRKHALNNLFFYV